MSLISLLRDTSIDDDEISGPRLDQMLSKMTQNMTDFSRGLRLLYAEFAVSGSENAKHFQLIRDAVRQDADIYCKKVLPLSNMVVLNISQYFDNYLSLSFEEWQENLEDIIKEVEEYENACEVLSHLHKSLMTKLKQHQDAAQVTTEEMMNLSEILKKRVKEVEQTVQEKYDSADSWSFWGKVLALPTLGIFTAIASSQANGKVAEAEINLAMAVADEANAEIQIKAALLTQEILIPSVEKFLDGLSACQAYFAITKGELIKMKSQSTSAAGTKEMPAKMKRYFNIMKKNGRTVDSACQAFIGSIGQVS